jgi:hypothetical protein
MATASAINLKVLMLRNLLKTFLLGWGNLPSEL